MCHKATVKNIYNVYYFKTPLKGIFNAVEKKSGIGFIVDALFGNFVYLHNLYFRSRTAYKLCIANYFESQPVLE